jgi:hypothetical protein
LKITQLSWLVLIYLLIGQTHCFSQRILRIDVDNEIKSLKIFEGDEIVFRTKIDKDWVEGRIEKIMVAEETILLENGMININEISEIRLTNHVANAVSKTLMTFGAAWWLYGGIGHLTSKTNKFDIKTLSIGGTALGVGYLTKKIAGYKIYKNGKNATMKLLDISF